MEHYDLPGNLPMAKDALQLHNEHSHLIKESRLSQLCQRCQDVIKRLRQPALHPHAFSPSKHPDIRDCMSRLEDHMSSLYCTCGLLTTLWRQKNRQLQECHQLRQLEYEYELVRNDNPKTNIVSLFYCFMYVCTYVHIKFGWFFNFLLYVYGVHFSTCSMLIGWIRRVNSFYGHTWILVILTRQP